MSRIHAVASWSLWSLGAALLLISILLVPQTRALGQVTTAPKVCEGPGTCNRPECVAANGNCPKACQTGSGTETQYFCKCLEDKDNCKDCICVLEPADGISCDCRIP